MRFSRESSPGKHLLSGLRSLPFLVLPLLTACDGDRGSQGEQGAQGPSTPTPTTLSRHENLPGVVIAITGLAGGTGPGGNFRPGDTLSVTFTIKKANGTALPIGELNSGGILVAGPTTNYQPVFNRATNLITASVANADGSYTYTFATPIPAAYLAPLNDTTSFGAGDGELQGQALLAGTYTVGIETYKNYTIEGTTYRDPGNTTKDFLMGDAASLVHREVVKVENCNQCHAQLRAHGTFRRDLTHCLLCHYAGAEDRNVATAAGGTPGVTIDFKVMIHKIHNGGHLPSVNGVTTNANGSRNYAAAPAPYKVVGNNNNVYDFSHVTFPVWPNLTNALPKDAGYTANPASQAQEDAIRTGCATCGKCHGDPDGSGPLAAPAQGGQAYSHPTRQACGSCHDDIDWTRPYVCNLQTMPAQADDSNCLSCHPASGAVLGTQQGHLHPLLDPAVNGGLVFNITSVTDAGDGPLNGKIDAGEKIQVQFSIKDDDGVDVDPSTLARLSVVMAGPTTNSQLLLNMDNAFPKAAVAASTVTINLPEKIWIEFLGDAPAGSDQALGTTVRKPHWNVTGGETVVQQRTATAGGDTTLALGAAAGQNYIDIDSAAGFARGDYIVVDDGVALKEEYLRIQWVDGTRLWFSSPQGPYSQPNLRTAHTAGATVKEVALTTKTVTTHYTLNAAAGTITEVGDNFVDGAAVIVTYLTDFVMPAVYPATVNDEPGQDETWGKWSGKSIVAGTYTVGIYGERAITLNRAGESNSYAGAAKAAVKNFLVGSATTLTPYAFVSSGANCYACHDDLWFHGSHRRGFESCLLCHGLSGAGDRPRYVAPNAPATAGTVIDFRQMLHKIHMGKELANASTYGVVGFGSTAHPDNYSLATYGEVAFPAMVGGARQCAVCHGASNTAWKVPSDRKHPTEQVSAFRGWYVACGSCHDSTAAQAHIALMTGSAESCAVCHGSGKGENVELVHKSW